MYKSIQYTVQSTAHPVTYGDILNVTLLYHCALYHIKYGNAH